MVLYVVWLDHVYHGNADSNRAKTVFSSDPLSDVRVEA